MPQAGHARVEIFDLRGKSVRTLHSGYVPAGPQKQEWNGPDNQNRTVSAGIYLAKVIVGQETEIVKLSLVK